MKQSLQLRIGQSLTMTPQLQQAIKLLQLSSLELQLEVQQALDSNMMLELADEADEVRDAPDGEGPALEAESINGTAPVSDFDGTSGGEGDWAGSEAAGSDAAEANETSEVLATEAGQTLDIPDELPVDSVWEDLYDGAAPAGAAPSEDGDFEAQRSAEPGLQEHLRWQINLAPLSAVDQAIALGIIDGISGDGYLTQSLEDIREAVALELGQSIEIADVEVMLRLIQSLDPLGVGARDLRECLLLQLNQKPADTPCRAAAITLVRDHLRLLGAKDYSQIMRRLKLSREQLKTAIALIQSLNPRPGAHLTPAEVEYVVADVFVRRVRGVWQVELNPEAVPSLRINKRYAAMIRRADNSNDNNSLRTHLQEARWFIKSLQSRSETLLKVATAIVERQQDFLAQGEEAMKPLVLHDIAEILGLHESTISRVTTRKYMHTPRGIFELKYFFSSHVGTVAGGEASSTAIRAFIRKLIASEDGRKPLSDNLLADLLEEQGFHVARRTVAKYREAMNIPPSNERKRLD